MVGPVSARSSDLRLFSPLCPCRPGTGDGCHEFADDAGIPNGLTVVYMTVPGRAGYDMNGARVSAYDARLRVPGQTRLPLNVVVDVSDGQLVFTRDDQELGKWPLDKVEVDLRSDGFHLNLGQEQIVLSVTDADGFAGALGAQARRRQAAGSTGGEGVAPAHPQPPLKRRGISGRLERISPEEQFADVRQRIYELKGAITDNMVAPPDFFRRWLRLLKELNVRHGQGAIPASVYYKLNTELLDLMPVPPSSPPPTTGRELVGLRG